MYTVKLVNDAKYTDTDTEGWRRRTRKRVRQEITNKTSNIAKIIEFLHLKHLTNIC